MYRGYVTERFQGLSRSGVGTWLRWFGANEDWKPLLEQSRLNSGVVQWCLGGRYGLIRGSRGLRQRAYV